MADKLLAKELYYLMVLGRKFEYSAKEYYLKGDISGFLHLDIGQEALSVSAMKAFQSDVFATYREHIMAIAKGIDPRLIMAELFGKSTGISGGRGGSMHLFDTTHSFYGGNAIVAGHIPNAVGCAYAKKFLGNDNGVMVVFGDGATNSGAFFESLNIASYQQLPLIFLCENNKYAIGTHITRVSPFEKQSFKAKPYMHTMQIDGMDALAVYDAVLEAQNYILQEHKPIFVEAFTCRFEGHSISDSNSYRSTQEMLICRQQDPIDRLHNQLLEKFDVSMDEILSLESQAQSVVDDAVEFALNSPEPIVESRFEHIFYQGDSYGV